MDKVQVKVFTEKAKVDDLLAQAREVYKKRDARVEGMTDEDEPIFYSCTLCQSFAPSHVCVVTPERTGLCGAYNWLDCKASNEINRRGRTSPSKRAKSSMSASANGRASTTRSAGFPRQSYEVQRLLHHGRPMTSCGCFECIAAVLPVANGVMSVDRDYKGLTPAA